MAHLKVPYFVVTEALNAMNDKIEDLIDEGAKLERHSTEWERVKENRTHLMRMTQTLQAIVDKHEKEETRKTEAKYR